MIIATARNIKPYYTKVKCDHCEYQYIPRSQRPLVCPKCRKPFSAVMIESRLTFAELKNP